MMEPVNNSNTILNPEQQQLIVRLLENRWDQICRHKSTEHIDKVLIGLFEDILAKLKGGLADENE